MKLFFIFIYSHSSCMVVNHFSFTFWPPLGQFEHDTVLVPRQTSWFGYYPDGTFNEILPAQQVKLASFCFLYFWYYLIDAASSLIMYEIEELYIFYCWYKIMQIQLYGYLKFSLCQIPPGTIGTYQFDLALVSSVSVWIGAGSF